MTPEVISLIGILALAGLIMVRVPVSVALGLVGTCGYAAIDGWRVAFQVLGQTPFDLAAGYALSVVPLFILMGVVASRGGLSRDLFTAANALFGRRRGALAMGAIGASAGFGAICGSSLATTATLARIAVPEMERFGYDRRLATGAVAVGGTLGILIPPSVMLVLYAIVANSSVPALFAAGLVPGLMLAALQIGVIVIVTRIHPGWAPVRLTLERSTRLAMIAPLGKLAILFVIAVGGIYTGIFSPTEAAAVAALGAIAMTAFSHQLTWESLFASLTETARTTAMLFFILLGAFIFAYFLARAQLPSAVVSWITLLGLPGWLVMTMLVGFYIVLGFVLESIATMLITVPVFLPLAVSLGYDPVWFGVLVVVAIEVGLVTPPVGLNIFVMRSQLPDIPLSVIYRGVLPFLAANLILIIALIALPGLALWLPAWLYG